MVTELGCSSVMRLYAEPVGVNHSLTSFVQETPHSSKKPMTITVMQAPKSKIAETGPHRTPIPLTTHCICLFSACVRYTIIYVTTTTLRTVCTTYENFHSTGDRRGYRNCRIIRVHSPIEFW